MPRRTIARTKLGARSRRCSASTDQRKSLWAVLKVSWTRAEKGQLEPDVLLAFTIVSGRLSKWVCSTSMGCAGTVAPPIFTPRERTICVSCGLMSSVTPHSQLGQRKVADMEPSSSRPPFWSNFIGSSHSVQTNFMAPNSLLDLRDWSLKMHVRALPPGTTPALPGRYHTPGYTGYHDPRLQPCADHRGYALAAARPEASPPTRSGQRADAPAHRLGIRTRSCSLPARARVSARDHVPG